MTPLRGETASALAGALRLLVFRQEGRRFFANDPGAAWRSFFALLLSAPAFYITLEDLRLELPLEEASLHFYAIWGLTYLLAWVAFPVILLTLGARQDFGGRVPVYIQLNNWLSVPASYIKLLATELRTDGGQPGLGDTLELIVVLWLVVNNWWLLRQTLGVRSGQAAALTVLGEATNYLLFSWAVLRTAC